MDDSTDRFEKVVSLFFSNSSDFFWYCNRSLIPRHLALPVFPLISYIVPTVSSRLPSSFPEICDTSRSRRRPSHSPSPEIAFILASATDCFSSEVESEMR